MTNLSNLQRLAKAIQDDAIYCIKKVNDNGTMTNLLNSRTHHGSITDVVYYLKESWGNVLWVYYMDESDESFTYSKIMEVEA